MLTPFQKARVRYHLGYPSERTQFFEVSASLVLDSLPEETVLQLVGDPSDPQIEFGGQVIGAEYAALGRCELAYQKLSPLVVDDSLFVSSAGSVTLRPDELRAREQLYQRTVADLAQLLDTEVFGKNTHGPSYRF